MDERTETYSNTSADLKVTAELITTCYRAVLSKLRSILIYVLIT